MPVHDRVRPFLLLTFAACGAAKDVQPQQPGGGNDAPLNPLPILMTCQMQPVSGGATLACTYQPPADLPLRARVGLTVTSKPQPTLSTQIVFDGHNVSTATKVLTVTLEELPLEVRADVIIDQNQVLGLESLTRITQEKEYTATDTTNGTVHTVGLPFAIWKLVLTYQSSFVGATIDPYSLDLGDSQPASPFVLSPTLPYGDTLTTNIVYVAVGPSTPLLSGKTTGGSSYTFQLPGGGAYVASAMGLRPSSAVVPIPDAGLPDAAPAGPCGTDGQPRCIDQNGFESCNVGFTYAASDSLCHTCGGDGQPQCFDQNGAPFCNPGFVPVSDGTCQAE